MSNPKQSIGKQGEYLAQAYLQARNIEIIATNWHCKLGEIDIVARDASVLCFIEVRTRRAASTEFALASITPAKRQKMIRAAYAFVADHHLPEETSWRIDIIAIALPNQQPPIIDHVEDALDW